VVRTRWQSDVGRGAAIVYLHAPASLYVRFSIAGARKHPTLERKLNLARSSVLVSGSFSLSEPRKRTLACFCRPPGPSRRFAPAGFLDSNCKASVNTRRQVQLWTPSHGLDCEIAIRKPTLTRAYARSRALCRSSLLSTIPHPRDHGLAPVRLTPPLNAVCQQIHRSPPSWHRSHRLHRL
jgi:hypothetical protein